MLIEELTGKIDLLKNDKVAQPDVEYFIFKGRHMVGILNNFVSQTPGKLGIKSDTKWLIPYGSGKVEFDTVEDAKKFLNNEVDWSDD